MLLLLPSGNNAFVRLVLLLSLCVLCTFNCTAPGMCNWVEMACLPASWNWLYVSGLPKPDRFYENYSPKSQDVIYDDNNNLKQAFGFEKLWKNSEEFGSWNFAKSLLYFSWNFRRILAYALGRL